MLARQVITVVLTAAAFGRQTYLELSPFSGYMNHELVKAARGFQEESEKGLSNHKVPEALTLCETESNRR